MRTPLFCCVVSTVSVNYAVPIHVKANIPCEDPIGRLDEAPSDKMLVTDLQQAKAGQGICM